MSISPLTSTTAPPKRNSIQSPAVDYSPGGAQTDLDSKTRPEGSAYDLEAYECSP
ncbi:MAG: hypothetical protein JW822_02745 [Spirochaetales bacterium]|nr:hypothetical protein [Spirochaetales bacterium]